MHSTRPMPVIYLMSHVIKVVYLYRSSAHPTMFSIRWKLLKSIAFIRGIGCVSFSDKPKSL